MNSYKSEKFIPKLLSKEQDGVPMSYYDEPYENLFETLSATAERLPNKVALEDNEGKVTYRQFYTQVNQLSDHLNQLGIGRGDRVGLMMVNSIAFCTAFYAIIKLGAMAVLVNTKLQSREIEFILHDSQPEALLLDGQWWKKVEPILNSSSVKKVILNHPVDTKEFAGASYDFSKLVEPSPIKISPTAPVRAAGDPAVLMYTSGTTGTPKGAQLSHFNMLQNIYAYRALLGLQESERTVLSVPIFHITGLGCVLTLFIYLGAYVRLLPFFCADETLEQMTKCKATHIHAVPTVYAMLTEAMKPQYDLTALDSAVCGGGHITLKNVQGFCAKAPHVKFHPAYGMTETAGAGVLFTESYLESSKIGSSGRVMPNAEIQIQNAEGNPVPLGSCGEICIRGSVVIKNYWKKSREENFLDGWLHSGDVGRLDEDGYIYIVDRLKDMINRGGEKIFSLELEDELLKLPEILQAAVYPVNDPLYGEAVAASIILRSGMELPPEKIRANLKAHLAAYKIPKWIFYCIDFPKTASGKIKKSELRKQMEAVINLKNSNEQRKQGENIDEKTCNN